MSAMTLKSHAKWLRKAAKEIRDKGHAGWGNTCEQAADAIDAHLARQSEGVSKAIALLDDLQTNLGPRRPDDDEYEAEQWDRIDKVRASLIAIMGNRSSDETDMEYADADALIAHLDGLMDDNGQGGEKWEPAQAAIRGIKAWIAGLAQEKAEPVAWMEPYEHAIIDATTKAQHQWASIYTIPLYTNPPAERVRVPADVAKLLRDVRAEYIGRERPSGDGCDAETWDRIESMLSSAPEADHG